MKKQKMETEQEKTNRYSKSKSIPFTNLDDLYEVWASCQKQMKKNRKINKGDKV